MLPHNRSERKCYPIGRFLRSYFPDAIAELARVSLISNEQHNPGEPMHWSRGKSMDHEDCLMRHFFELGKLDTDGISHTAKVAWRALALLQLELEELADEVTTLHYFQSQEEADELPF